MKPWLLEILACPVDKHFPLALDIFTIEDEQGVLAKAGNVKEMAADLEGFFEPVPEQEGEAVDPVVVHVSDVDGKIMVFDTLVRKPAPVQDYLDGIMASIEELRPVTNHAHPKVGELVGSLLAFKDDVARARDAVAAGAVNGDAGASLVASLTPRLVLLNWVKQAIEIDEGIMTCPACRRWYPIRETIPQLLPDELRKNKYDVDFLTKWKERVDPSVLKEGLPFHL